LNVNLSGQVRARKRDFVETKQTELGKDPSDKRKHCEVSRNLLPRREGQRL
jgi:hypothetical protein